jgi:hypothetical protein
MALALVLIETKNKAVCRIIKKILFILFSPVCVFVRLELKKQHLIKLAHYLRVKSKK